MKNKIKIAVIPIDNRPICYDIIFDVLNINSDIELFMPDIKDLGGLTTQSDTNNIIKFLNNLENIDYLIVSLDTLAYGGLIPSRRCDDDFETIKKRIDDFKKAVKKKASKILAFSSVMRISNNNINEEEKPYWAAWGKKIFDWSYNFHKSRAQNKEIPDGILKDYLDTRKRNFKINQYYLKLAQEGFFDTLIFSKDDCSEFGLNVLEANELEKEAKEKNLNNVLIKTGADEIPLSLITRAISENENIKIKPVFNFDKSTGLISKYEDISIKNCVLAQIALANLKTDSNPDLTLIINNFEKEQGDLVLGEVINNSKKEVIFPNTPYFIADVNNANGADCNLIKQLFNQKTDNFYGYCGYNTSANTLGAAIFCAVVKYLALKNKSYKEKAFNKIQFIRFLDDWAYQAISRKFVREAAPEFLKALKEKEPELNSNAKKIADFLNFKPDKITYSLPWDRSFEIRIKTD